MHPESPTEEIKDIHIFILHGDEEVGIRLALQKYLDEVEQNGMADFNLSRLDGRLITQNDLHDHLNQLPFGSGLRLVILTHALSMVKSEAGQKDFIGLLDGLAPTTKLVMVIEDSYRYAKGKTFWEILTKERWFTQWLENHKGYFTLQEYISPKQNEMQKWITIETERQGGKIDSRAAQYLAIDTGTDTMLASQEIGKLITYVGNGNLIKDEDVRLLCNPVDREDIFGLVDAIAEGKADVALRLLDISLQKQSDNNVFPMIVRHFRLLIITKEILEEGGNLQTVENILKAWDWLAKKYMSQARRFTQGQLDEIYQRLNRLDMQLKDSRISPDLAMELFVADLARK
jgi:DNA polymerase III delta subunit